MVASPRIQVSSTVEGTYRRRARSVTSNNLAARVSSCRFRSAGLEMSAMTGARAKHAAGGAPSARARREYPWQAWAAVSSLAEGSSLAVLLGAAPIAAPRVEELLTPWLPNRHR